MEYKETDRMFDVICDRVQLLQMMSRFGISLGFGEKTVREVCADAGVDVTTFLAVANYLRNGASVAPLYTERISVRALTEYLKQAHRYFLDFQLPDIRRKLIGAIDCSQTNEVAYLILKFYDEYMNDVRRHMDFENNRVFTYVDSLLSGNRPRISRGGNAPISGIAQFSKSHVGINGKLQELKSLIIKYYNAADATELLNNVLIDIFSCEEDLRQHCHVEDDLFVPAVELLEERIAAGREPRMGEIVKADLSNALSEREKEIVAFVVRGMSNKDIAEKLFISANTVLTHRKNIFRKLDIHSVSGLTIYAIVNGIVKLDDVKL